MKKCTVNYEDVICWENLCAAWEEFVKGKRKKRDVQEFALHLADEMLALHGDFIDDVYIHGPYRRFAINDPKPRTIHKATVRDRLVHHAVHRQFYAYFAERFVIDSFSCQKGKGLHAGLNRFRTVARQISKNGTTICWVLKCDIRKFFASVDHDVLLELLGVHVADARLMALLRNVIRSFSASPGKGLPLGNLTSQLFANIYLHELDHFIKNRIGVRGYIRYADDFVLLSDSREDLVDALPRIAKFLEVHLRLALHPKKVTLQTFASGVDFLGWVHFPHHRVPRTVTRRRIQRRLREKPTNAALQSYLGLLGYGNAFRLQNTLENDYWLWGEK